MDSVHDNADNAYKIDPLTAMKYVNLAWDGIPQNIIYNCWRTIGLLPLTEALDMSRKNE